MEECRDFKVYTPPRIVRTVKVAAVPTTPANYFGSGENYCPLIERYIRLRVRTVGLLIRGILRRSHSFEFRPSADGTGANPIVLDTVMSGIINRLLNKLNSLHLACSCSFSPMGNSQSFPPASQAGSPLQLCLNNVFTSSAGSVSYPQNAFYQLLDVKAYNRHIPITPAAVTRPTTSEEISKIVACAGASGVKVQARSGGHSFANYG